MSVAVKWCKWCCGLLLITFLILPNFNDGFRLKDITLPEKSDDSYSPKPVQPREFPPFKKIVKIVHVDDDGNEEVTDFKFEKVHKADFPKPQAVHKTTTKKEENKEDIVGEEASDSAGWSISSIFGMFGFGRERKAEPESNGIIDWLKSFSNKSDSREEAIPTESTQISVADWISYLDRWPFNLFFPFEKSKSSKEGETTDASDAASKTQDKDGKPLSQVDFETLLHRLPNFVINPSEAESIECQKQLHIFHRQLRGYKLWTLQMLDASGKIPAGILRGNVNQLGDFDLCAHIKTVVKITSDQPVRIKGKYCLAHIEVSPGNEDLRIPLYLAQGRGLWNSHLDNPAHFVPRYTIIKWGVCVPNSCSSTDVLHMLQSTVKPYNETGLNFRIDVSEDDCYVRKKLRVVNLLLNNWKICLTLGLYALFTSIVLIATLVDNWSIIKKYSAHHLKNIFKVKKENNESTKKDERIEPKEEAEEETSTGEEKTHKRSTLKEIVLCFSVKRTLGELFSIERNFIKIVPVLRVLCTGLLYLCLKFLLIGHLPIVNRDKLIKTVDNPLSIVIRSPLLYLDTLLLISGLLSTLQLSQEIQGKTSVSVIKRIMGNILRYLPTLYSVLLFQTWILPHIGSGPLWSSLIGQNSKMCEQNMWRNFFAVQNVIDFEKTCSPMTTQLAVELQLYLLAPLLIWLYYSNGDIGFMVYGAIHAISVAIRFSRTNIDSLSSTLFHGMNVSKFYRTANISFASPLHRLTAYLVGIGIGLLLQSNGDRPRFSKVPAVTGWVAAIWCIFWCFWYPSHNTSTEFIYDPTEAAVYSSWAPLLLSLAIGWIIFMTQTTTLPFVVESLILSRPIVLLGKISYPLQLVMYTVLLFSTAQQKETVRFHASDLINLKEIFVIIVLSMLLSIFVDIPLRRLRKVLLISTSTECVGEEKLGIDSETEELNSEGRAEEPTSLDLKEEDAIEDIWGSEPEKDDVAYKFNNIRSAYDGLGIQSGWTKNESPYENWRTESDIDQNEATQEIETKEKYNEEECEEVEEEEEIDEEDEIIRRPASPVPLFRRRRWDVDED